LRRRPGRSATARLCRSGPDGRRVRGGCRRQSGDPRRARLRRVGRPGSCLHGGDRAHLFHRHRLRRQARVRGEAAGCRRVHSRRCQRPGPPGPGARQPSAGGGPGRSERRVRLRPGAGRAALLRARCRRRSHRHRRARRRGDRRPGVAGPCPGGAAGSDRRRCRRRLRPGRHLPLPPARGRRRPRRAGRDRRRVRRGRRVDPLRVAGRPRRGRHLAPHHPRRPGGGTRQGPTAVGGDRHGPPGRLGHQGRGRHRLMLYVSTRGGAPPREFADILLEGLAPDGGLYVPKENPRLPPLPDDYASAVAALVRPFVEPDPLGAELEEMVADVYGRFRHADVAPRTQVDNDLYVLELFWGPTLSFKDYALQLVGPLFQRVLEREGRRLLVLGATSGDTGSAAIEGCRGLPGIEIVILYPEGAVSEVQRRQMTTVPDANVHAVAVRGTFDDCQRLVKQAFTTLGDRHPLGAVNSINWARIVAQSAYYAYWAQRLGRPVRFVVPTGNFGNVYAAHLARRMGAEISKLVVANNANHGLADLVTTGVLRVSAVEHTFAPAMDIQVPSNLERYL